MRWSWGSVRSDGTVFLRVWQDEVQGQMGSLSVRIWCDPEDEQEEGMYPGPQERLKHIELVKKGSPCYLVMCVAEDTKALPRKVREFNDEYVWRGGSIYKVQKDTFIEMRERVRVLEVVKQEASR